MPPPEVLPAAVFSRQQSRSAAIRLSAMPRGGNIILLRNP
jgi:hypothetical protein